MATRNAPRVSHIDNSWTDYKTAAEFLGYSYDTISHVINTTKIEKVWFKGKCYVRNNDLITLAEIMASQGKYPFKKGMNVNWSKIKKERGDKMLKPPVKQVPIEVEYNRPPIIKNPICSNSESEPKSEVMPEINHWANMFQKMIDEETVKTMKDTANCITEIKNDAALLTAKLEKLLNILTGE